MSDVEGRLDKLEKELQALKLATKAEETPVFGIAAFIGLVLYVVLIANLPFHGDPDFWPRVGIGVASGFGGLMVFFGALELVKFALKAIVEVLAVILLFLDASVAALLWANPAFRANLLSLQDGERAALIIGIAVVVFLANVLLLFVLYPLARVAGTKLD